MSDRTTPLLSWLAAGTATVAAVVSGVLLHASVPDLESSAPFALIGAVAAGLGLFLLHFRRRAADRVAFARSAAIQAANDQRMRLLESAVVHTHDGVVILEAAPNGGAGRSVLYVNDAFSRMTGYTRDELVGRSLHMLRGPDSDQATLDRLRAALDSGTPLQDELLNYRKDGTGFWVELSLVPVPDPAGGAAHWVMIQRDVSDRKRAEAELRHSEGLFRGIFEGTSAGVSLTDPAGRFVSCNPAFAAMLGRTVEEVLQLTPRDITHPDDWPGQQPLVAEVRAGKRDRFNHTKRYVRPDGEAVWVELSFAAIRGPGGEYEHGLGVSVNVTERRRLEQQLQQAQKMEAIGQMAGGVAHDFNNILTAVLGNLSLVKLPHADPSRPLLAAVEQAATRAADLTRKLLGYARRNQLVIGPVPPRDAFAEVLGLLRRTFDPRVRIEVAVASGCGPALADPGLLNQALLNLCINSRDAMPAGGTLTLSADPVELTPEEAAAVPDARAGSFVRIGVADTGAGMTDEVRARVFEPFFTTKPVGQGTGLGLPMVQGIVKQHRGWVAITTCPKGGTRIDLYLPVAPAEPPRSGMFRPAVPPDVAVARELAPTNGHHPAGDRRTILLVDDEAMIRDLGRTVLETAGYRVVVAEDGVEAVEVFARERDHIDLVILDVTMPRMSGLDAYRHITELAPGARILFSTGYSTEDVAELDGALGLLSKPYRPHELLAAVRDALSAEPTAAG